MLDLAGRRFAAYATDSVPAETALAITLPTAGPAPEALIPWVVGAVALALGAGLVLALRRKPTPRCIRHQFPVQ